MMKLNCLLVAVFISLALSLTMLSRSQSQDDDANHPAKSKYEAGLLRHPIPPGGYVPDKPTALAIARALFVSRVGEEEVKKVEPFQIVLDDNSWFVTVRRKKKSVPPVGGAVPALHFGGGMSTRIDKSNGRIYYVYIAK